MNRLSRTVLASIAAGVVGFAGLPALAATLGTSPTSVDSATASPGLSTGLADRLASDLDDPIGIYVHGTDHDAAQRAVAAAGLNAVADFERVGVVATVADATQVAALQADPGVVYIEADELMTFDLDTSNQATRGAEVVEGFDITRTTTVTEERPVILKNGKPHPKKTETVTTEVETTETVSYDGSGVTVAVVDSGVDGTHPFFQRADGTSKVARNLRVITPCVVGLAPCGTEDEFDYTRVEDVPGNNSEVPGAGGHGTHVSGIAAGVEVTPAEGLTFHGAAPGADLVVLSVEAGVFLGPNVGLNWILENHADPCGDGSCPPIKVINNSYGAVSAGAQYDPESLTAKIQDALVDEGVVMVWAAGNGDELNDGGDGSDIRTNDDGQSPTPGIISVANYDDGDVGTRDGELSPSSSRGMKGNRATYPDLSAPGTSILSSCRIHLSCGSSPTSLDYGSISGTSMAAPHIAGIVAQLFEADPTLTPAEVEDILEDTAHEFGGDYEPDLADRNADGQTSFDKGHGLVDVVAAVSRVLGVDGPSARMICTVDGPIAVDPAGDGSENGVLPNEPSLDLLEGRASWDEAAQALTVAIEVADLSSDAGVPTAHRATFTHEGQALFVLAERDRQLGTQSFQYGYVGTISRTVGDDTDDTDGDGTLDGFVYGSIDETTDRISITMTNGAIDNINTAIAANADGTQVTTIDDGEALTGWSFTANRRYSAVAVSYNPPSDTAGGLCPYTIGLGAVPPPGGGSDGGGGGNGGGPTDPVAPPEDSDHDHVLGYDGTLTFSGTAPTTPVYPAAGVAALVDNDCLSGDDPNCDHVKIWVESRGVLTITTSFVEGDDWDTWVFDDSFAQVGQAATSDNPEVLVTITLEPGLYTFSAMPFLTTGGYDAVATLTVPPT